MSLREGLRNAFHRWIDSDWGERDHSRVTAGLSESSLWAPTAVEEMARDAIAEANRPEQERRHEEFEREREPGTDQ